MTATLKPDGGSSGFLLPPRGGAGNAQTLLPYAWSQWGQWWAAVVACVTLLTTGRWWMESYSLAGGAVFCWSLWLVSRQKTNTRSEAQPQSPVLR